LPGLSEALESIYPETIIQKCIVHQIRNSLKYIPSKHTKGFLKEKVDNILKFLHNNEKEIKLSIKKELVSLYPKSKFYSFIRPNFPWRG